MVFFVPLILLGLIQIYMIYDNVSDDNNDNDNDNNDNNNDDDVIDNTCYPFY